MRPSPMKIVAARIVAAAGDVPLEAGEVSKGVAAAPPPTQVAQRRRDGCIAGSMNAIGVGGPMASRSAATIAPIESPRSNRIPLTDSRLRGSSKTL